jgi:ribosome recycling factor
MIDSSLDRVLEETREHMQKSIDHLTHELSHVRAGRATPTMVDEVRVEAYGQQMPLNQIASVSAPQSDLIVIQPWDKSTLGPIERAIQAANLGFNPSNDGQLIRIALPPLTEERRRELAKTAKGFGEDAKISIRNVRRTTKDEIKKVTDAESLSEDMRFESEERLQAITDEFTSRIDEIIAKKEKDILTV